MFDRGVVKVVLIGYIVYHYCLRFDIGSCCCWYILYHCSLRFDRRDSCCRGFYIVYHCYFRFDTGVVHVVVVILSIIAV